MLFSFSRSAQLLLERQRMELARRGEATIDHLLRHTVVQCVEEADILTGIAHLLGQALQRAGLAGEIRAVVDHRNLCGRCGRNPCTACC